MQKQLRKQSMIFCLIACLKIRHRISLASVSHQSVKKTYYKSMTYEKRPAFDGKKSYRFYKSLLREILDRRSNFEPMGRDELSEKVLFGIGAHGTQGCVAMLQMMYEVDDIFDYFIIVYNSYLSNEMSFYSLEKIMGIES